MKFSIVIDRILEKIRLGLPNRSIIPNPYSLLDNNVIYLRDGLGLRIENTLLDDHISFQTFEHRITVILTNEIIKMESDETAVLKADKKIMEDFYILSKYMYLISSEIEYLDFFVIDRVSNVNYTTNGKYNYQYLELELRIKINDNNC